MSQHTVVDDYEQEQMSGKPVAPDDEAAAPGAAATGTPLGDTSPPAGEQEPADGRSADAVGAAEPSGVPAVAGEIDAGQAEPVGGAEYTGGAESMGGAEPVGGAEYTSGAEPVGGAEYTGGAEPAGGAEHTGGAEPMGAAAPSAGSAADRALLDRETLQRRWQEVQASFVDEPRHAVEEADSLVSDTVRELADSLAAERSGIEREWHGVGDASTEDFRVALLRYRDVFRLLLSV